MLSLAENLGKLLTQVGGITKAKFLLKPLEQLCGVEDTAVRAKAVASVQIILTDANLKDLEAELVGMIKRLYEADWSTSKNSAVLLIPFFYSGLTPNGQKELMKYYLQSIEHENHTLRRTAGQVLN